MINVPWYVRVGVDSVLLLGPFYFLTTHNGLIYEFFREKRRVNRRLGIDQVNVLDDVNLND